MTDADRDPAAAPADDTPVEGDAPVDDAPADGDTVDGVPAVLARHVPAVAAETGVAAAALRENVGRLHDSVTEYPGVADLVFEYRRAFSHDPLVDRQAGTYYLLVPPQVWPEFGAALGVDDRALAALRAVHDRAFAAGTEFGDRGDWVPLVLVD